MRILLGLITLLAIGYIQSNEIDNHLVGEPAVDCQDTMVALTFNTEKPFTGRVYVKGLADDDRCSRNFATNPDQTKFTMNVQTGDCSMQRQRVAGQLEGIVFSLIVVVSFHGTFVTKVDRAYRCMCFFRNIKRITNVLDMSDIGTTELLDTAKTPTCTYMLRVGSPDGPVARYAKVGDKIFHVWECDDVNSGFLVHSCWVNDGRGAKFDFYDIDGCAVDPIIMPDIKYEADLTKAFVEVHGFKFSDTTVLNFQCVLELCKKLAGECADLTPPQCGRGKRSVNENVLIFPKNDPPHGPPNDLTDSSFDVVSSMTILDSFDEDLQIPSSPQNFLRNINSFQPEGLVTTGKYGKTCVSSGAFGIFLGIMIITFLTSVITTSLLCVKLRRPEPQKEL